MRRRLVPRNFAATEPQQGPSYTEEWKSMACRLALLILCAGLCARAELTLTIEQLKEFVRSSIKLHQDDRKVAEYLKKVTLKNQLDDRTIEDLQGLGAGPRTVEALHRLRDLTASLPKAPPPAPRPAYVPPPPPNSIEQKQVLADATDYALNYTSRLPDFICTQVTRRYIDPSGMEFWRLADTITERLSFYERHEDYKVVLVNSQPVEMAHEKLGGVVSAGEFGSMMQEIFNPETETQFDWERWATLRGKRMHVFSYKVSQGRSKYSIVAEGNQRIIAGYHGLIYVDRNTSAIMKITLTADGIPAGFPVREVNTSLDYDHVSISDRDFILPLKAVVTSRIRDKFLTKNEVEFRMYRKFTAESTITAVDVDTPAPLPPDATKEQPAAVPDGKKPF
jgi:hypothetical protein